LLSAPPLAAAEADQPGPFVVQIELTERILNILKMVTARQSEYAQLCI